MTDTDILDLASFNGFPDKEEKEADMKTPREYWTELKSRAADNLHMISGYPIPQTEDQVKHIVHAALKHGTYAEAAQTILEADEWVLAQMCLGCLNATGA